jgi:uncharacterized membrane protein YdjX (TVP38/TMEM64 family)
MAPTKRAASPNPKPKEAKEGDAKTPEAKSTEKTKATTGGLLSKKTALIVAVTGCALYAAKTFLGDKIDMKQLMEDAIGFVESKGQTAVYWYMAMTLVGVVCLVPTTPMEVAGGFLFSPTYGMWTVLAFTGGTKLVANVISVLIARHLVKDWVMENVVAKSELLTMVSLAVKEEPWKMAFLVRGSMVPLFVKNYGLGVMDIDYLPIAACACIFTNFYAFQNIYMGAAMENMKEVFAPKKAAAGPMDWTATIKKMMPIVFNILLVVFLVKAVKAQIKKQKAAIEASLKEKTEKKAS